MRTHQFSTSPGRRVGKGGRPGWLGRGGPSPARAPPGPGPLSTGRAARAGLPGSRSGETGPWPGHPQPPPGARQPAERARETRLGTAGRTGSRGSSAPFGRGGSEGARSPSGASAAPRGDPPSQPPTRPDSCPTRSSMSRWHRCKSNQKGPCGSPVTNQVYVSNSLKVSSFRYSNEPSLQALTQQATG